MKDKNTFYDIISNSAKETIEIKLTHEVCKALKECFEALKEIQPVVIDFEEEKEFKWDMKCFYQLFFQ